MPGGLGTDGRGGKILHPGARTQPSTRRRGRGAGVFVRERLKPSLARLVAAVQQMSSSHFDRLLSAVNEQDASDLHLVAGVPPAFRVNGEIILANEDALTGEELNAVADGLLNEQQRKKLEHEWELCISMHHRAAGRVRVTFYRRNGHTEMSLRFCGHRIASREELGLPEKIDELARRPNGLVLVTGPTGAGKTTTLNYLVDLHQQRAPLQNRHHRRPHRIRA